MKYSFAFRLSLIALLFSSVVLAQQNTVVQLLPAKTFQQNIANAGVKQIIDVRTPQEFNAGHLGDAKNINIYDNDFKESLEKLDKQAPVFVYCKAGVRSTQAATLMRQMGFKNIYDLDGGIMSWEKNGFPVTTSTLLNDARPFSSTDFDTLLVNNPVLLIDYYAPWCGPCKKMEPSLQTLSAKYAGKITFFRINLDEAKMLATQLNIESIPVLAVYKNGKEIKRLTGFQSIQKIEALAKLVLKN